jgi:hypothetical protein
MEVDPEAVVIDTHAVGMKDLVSLAYKLIWQREQKLYFVSVTRP